MYSIFPVSIYTALVEVSQRTTVTPSANAYDERTSNPGCTPDGCTPENTLDGNRRAVSRWSCKEDLVEENCAISYNFEEPQDVVKIKLAFYKGSSTTRKLKVKVNGSTHSYIESSGETGGYQTFRIDADNTETLALEAVELDGDEWISIKEVCMCLPHADVTSISDTCTSMVLFWACAVFPNHIVLLQSLQRMPPTCAFLF